MGRAVGVTNDRSGRSENARDVLLLGVFVRQLAAGCREAWTRGGADGARADGRPRYVANEGDGQALRRWMSACTNKG